ncbi:hypothetical protein H5410_047900 [Solanum commersonii]|uniref:Uncharacterized protein n=1 Tax=Solanum commersonii TaxID=4109 RepID=A0A9J5XIF8_SOLCO|nr:hypothetical protein H5410_047900 [Solanum commersonii]
MTTKIKEKCIGFKTGREPYSKVRRCARFPWYDPCTSSSLILYINRCCFVFLQLFVLALFDRYVDNSWHVCFFKCI